MGTSARALTSRSIGFGLVNVPVRLYTAQREGRVAFNQITPAGNRVNSVSVDSVTREPVAKESLRKGYALDRDTYVIVSDAEIESAKPAKSERIEIDTFVDATTVSPVRFEKTYWLGPDKGGEKPYALLLAAVRESGKVGIGTLVYSGKQKMVMVSVVDGVLAATTLFYDDEVVAPEGIVPEVTVNPKELELAMSLVDAQEGEFAPAQYHDHYREEIERMVQAKASGLEFNPERAEPAASQVENLMDALTASVAQIKARRAA